MEYKSNILEEGANILLEEGLTVNKLTNDVTANSNLYVTGKVGIGTTTPSQKLEVAGNIQLTNKSNSILFGSSGSDGTWGAPKITRIGTQIIISDFSGVQLGGYDGSSYGPRLTVTGAGNVGIGTTSPAKTLDVVGNARLSTAYANVGLSTITYAQLQGLPFILSDTTLDNAVGQVVTGIGFGYGNEITAAIVATDRGGSAAQSLDFITGTSTTPAARMSIDSAGNVGIGTTNPLYKLHVVGSTYVNSGTLFIDSGEYIRWGNSTQGIRGVNDTSLEFVVGSSTRMYVSSSGNVGIGTSSPTSKLYIEGGSANWNETTPGLSVGTIHLDPGADTNDFGNAITFGASDAGGGTNAQAGIYLRSDGNYGTKMYFATTDSYAAGSKTRMFIGHDGNVGIGTTAPSQKVDVVGAGATNLRIASDSTAETALHFGNTTGGRVSVRSNAYLALDTNAIERMRITSAGNVGIGTTAPGDKLDVSGNVRFGTGGSASWGNGLLTLNSGWGTGLYPTVGSYGGSSGSLIMLQNPHVPFRTDNAAPGSYTGRAGLRMAIDTTATNWWDAGLAGDFYHIYKSGVGEFLRITAAGNVGIGTTAPTSKLFVLGSGTYNTSTSEILESDATIFSSEMSNDSYNSILQLVSVRQSLTTGNASNGFLGFSTIDDSNAQGVRDAGRIAIVNEVGSSRNSATALSFWTNSGGTNTTAATEKVRITSAGNVGIGTTSPSQRLVVSGSAIIGDSALDNPQSWGRMLQVSNSGTNGAGISVKDSNNEFNLATYSGAFYISDGVDERITITAAGNVGIGTTNPSRTLDVNGEIQNNGIIRRNGAVYIKSTGTSTLLGPGGSGFVSFHNSATMTTGDEVMRITGNNVGIGTTSPSVKLHVNGEGIFDDYLTLGVNNTDGKAGIYFDEGNIASRATSAMYITYDGTNVGGDNNNISLGSLKAGVGDILRITYGGKVGIGTANPSYRLHVSGAIAIEAESTTTKYSTTFSGSLTTNTNIASVPTASFKAAFFDYYVASGSVNMRAGTVMAVHNNSTSRYTDTSTGDIGTTAAVDFSTSIVAGSLVLTANISSGTWEVKTAYRAL